MTFKTKFIIPIFFGACILFVLGSRQYYNSYHANIRSKPKGYVYETYRGPVNPVLYVEKQRHIDSLIAYYTKIEHGDTNAYFNFPPLSLPYDTCVYILGYERDSMVAKVISYYDWGKKGDFGKG